MDRLILQQNLKQQNIELNKIDLISFHGMSRSTCSHAEQEKRRGSYITAASIIFAAFNLVQRGIREVEFLSTMIYGQAVGSFNVTANDHKHVGSIQGGPHDAGSLLVPVGPEHETVMGTNKLNDVQWEL